jgi:hypothetical protein
MAPPERTSLEPGDRANGHEAYKVVFRRPTK